MTPFNQLGMSDSEIFARNQRFSGLRSCIITECPDDVLALFSWGGSGELLYLGTDHAELIRSFLARPTWSYHPPAREQRPATYKGLDLSSLDIDI